MFREKSRHCLAVFRIKLIFAKDKTKEPDRKMKKRSQTMWRLIALWLVLVCALPLQAKGLKVLFIGDSITDGAWGRSGGSQKSSEERNHGDKNHIYGHSYMFLCAAHYESRYPERDYQFYNRGISGYTLTDLEQRWERDVTSLCPDILSILVGTNDVQAALDRNEPMDISTWEQRYRALLDRALQVNPKMKIIIGIPFAANVGKMKKSVNYPQRQQQLEACGQALRRVAADYHALLLPYDALFASLLQGPPSDRDTYWIWDGIHPTPAGHHRMAELWIQEVDKRGWM